MVLMSVDLPQPFGPRIAMCSPDPMVRLIFRRAIFSPRMTVTLRRSIKGGEFWADKQPVYFATGFDAAGTADCMSVDDGWGVGWDAAFILCSSFSMGIAGSGGVAGTAPVT